MMADTLAITVVDVKEPAKQQQQDEPYSVFSTRTKILIVMTVSISGFFSPFSTNIYFPALTCIGLACTRNFETLLSLRMLQAIGSSSAIAVGAGSIGDISTPAERGGYMGIYSMCSFLGPLMDILAARHYGSSSLAFSDILTARNIALSSGQWIHLRKSNAMASVEEIPIQHGKRSAKGDNNQDKQAVCIKHPDEFKNAKQTMHVSNANRWRNVPNPFQSLAYLKEKDVAVLLLYNSLQYAGLYSVLTSLTELFIGTYGLDEFQVGLCFLSNGFGASIGSFTAGRLLNWKFHQIAKSLNMDEKYTKRGNLDPDFPIESARMGFTWIWGIAFSVAMIAYGWCLFYKVHIAIPIMLNFASWTVSCLSTSTFTATNTLLVDLFPKNSAAIIASNNLTRCFLAAAVVMAVQPGIERLGVGWMFTLISLVLLVSRVSMVVLLRYGPKWRNQRLQKRQTL
ncbi:hypothetical protein G6F42_016406 [Rhizopus arrhizus]|nr:hypothetical protein G6F42_016406 [Rhizopus arrhizus]